MSSVRLRYVVSLSRPFSVTWYSGYPEKSLCISFQVCIMASKEGIVLQSVGVFWAAAPVERWRGPKWWLATWHISQADEWTSNISRAIDRAFHSSSSRRYLSWSSWNSGMLKKDSMHCISRHIEMNTCNEKYAAYLFQDQCAFNHKHCRRPLSVNITKELKVLSCECLDNLWELLAANWWCSYLQLKIKKDFT